MSILRLAVHNASCTTSSASRGVARDSHGQSVDARPRRRPRGPPRPPRPVGAAAPRGRRQDQRPFGEAWTLLIDTGLIATLSTLSEQFISLTFPIGPVFPQCRGSVGSRCDAHGVTEHRGEVTRSPKSDLPRDLRDGRPPALPEASGPEIRCWTTNRWGGTPVLPLEEARKMIGTHVDERPRARLATGPCRGSAGCTPSLAGACTREGPRCSLGPGWSRPEPAYLGSRRACVRRWCRHHHYVPLQRVSLMPGFFHFSTPVQPHVGVVQGKAKGESVGARSQKCWRRKA